MREPERDPAVVAALNDLYEPDAQALWWQHFDVAASDEQERMTYNLLAAHAGHYL